MASTVPPTLVRYTPPILDAASQRSTPSRLPNAMLISIESQRVLHLICEPYQRAHASGYDESEERVYRP